jgi:hypothetical protein
MPFYFISRRDERSVVRREREKQAYRLHGPFEHEKHQFFNFITLSLPNHVYERCAIMSEPYLGTGTSVNRGEVDHHDVRISFHFIIRNEESIESETERLKKEHDKYMVDRMTALQNVPHFIG